MRRRGAGGRRAAKGLGALLQAVARLVGLLFGAVGKLFGRAGGRGSN